MKLSVLLIAFLATWSLNNETLNTENMSVYDFKIKSLTGGEIDMNSLKGKKILFVNTASKCGYTPQYAELQELHEKYGSKVTVIGLPCNQFGSQEPGSESEIATFCEANYGVSFQMTEKIDVKGSDQHPLYAWLTQKELNGKKDTKVKWNFQKYLVSEDGEWLAMFPSGTSPMDEEITDWLK